MRNAKLNKKQKELFKILVDFKYFAEKNKIKYFLSAGSLLGAVKYGKFIPWDDDIDIYILREDFIKLCKILLNSNSKYTLCKIYFNDRFLLKKNKNFKYFLDVSVLDKSPKTKIGSMLIHFAQIVLRCSIYKKLILNQKNFIQKIIFLIYFILGKILLIILGKKNIYNLQIIISKIGKSKQYYKLYSSDIRYLKTNFKKSWFIKQRKIKFNGVKFNTLRNINDYLYQQYGDIRKNPDISQQKPNHKGLSSFVYDFYKTLGKN